MKLKESDKKKLIQEKVTQSNFKDSYSWLVHVGFQLVSAPKKDKQLIE